MFHVLRGPFQEEFYQCVTFGSYKEDWQRQLYSVASLLLMFVLPLVIIGTAYGLIFTTISRKSREVSGESRPVCVCVWGWWGGGWGVGGESGVCVKHLFHDERGELSYSRDKQQTHPSFV